MPILYSFRRCPYAIAARMSLELAGIDYELREVNLKDKPQALLDCSPKGTVPVLVLDDKVLEESGDVVRWALSQTKYPIKTEDEMGKVLISKLLGYYLPLMHQYKYSEEEEGRLIAREGMCAFFEIIDQLLSEHEFLLSAKPSDCDLRVYPLIRQGLRIDAEWFDTLDFPHLKRWVAYWEAWSDQHDIMRKVPFWQDADEAVIVVHH